jgi:hypothetical protein
MITKVKKGNHAGDRETGDPYTDAQKGEPPKQTAPPACGHDEALYGCGVWLLVVRMRV